MEFQKYNVKKKKKKKKNKERKNEQIHACKFGSGLDINLAYSPDLPL